MVGAFEPNVDASTCRLRPRKHVGEQGAGPPGGGDGIGSPWLAGRQRSHLETPVPGAFESDGPIDRRQRAEVLEGQRGRVLHRTADVKGAVVRRDREVAADVVEVGWSQVRGEGFGRRLGVVRGGVDSPAPCFTRKNRLNSLVGPALRPGRGVPVTGAVIGSSPGSHPLSVSPYAEPLGSRPLTMSDDRTPAGTRNSRAVYVHGRVPKTSGTLQAPQ